MSQPSVPDLDFNTPALRRFRKMRAAKDKVAKWGIAIGGVSIIGAVLLIFFYLLYEVFPVFIPAKIEKQSQYAVPALTADPGTQTLMLTMEEQAEVGLRITANGNMVFFNANNGDVIDTRTPPLAAPVTAFVRDTQQSSEFAFGAGNGTALVLRHRYSVTYPNDVRVITPDIEYPYGEEPVVVFEDGASIAQMTMRDSDSGLTIVASDAADRIVGSRFSKEENFMTGEVTMEREALELPPVSGHVSKLLLDQSQRWLYVLTDNRILHVLDLRNGVLNSSVKLTTADHKVTDIEFLLGGNSLMVSTDEGKVSQWFQVREKGEFKLENVRQFETANAQVRAIEVEHRRKGFVVASAQGEIALYHSTAHRTLLDEKISDNEIMQLGISPRGKHLLVEDSAGQILRFSVENEHPEVSWSSMWDEVWYEGYEQPSYTWQSTAANNDFEPKYSLVPLAFGTIKGAFYAMLLAAPLAIAGAVYTAYFMAPALRRKVKPIIELMEALPTVILGFLAGLALAPFVEHNLPGIFAMLLLVPFGMLLFGYTWVNMPARIRHRVPDGFDALLLVPVVILMTLIAIQLSAPMEEYFFGGSMVHWLDHQMGVTFSQRNALIVGLAMGFAVIPNIFSIAEDAIFSVPKSLSYGSLALGATPWQTLVRVVLPTASPGIFSALMIGLGRAVGETMIVLMATGNTPITDVNIFEGMRTLAANIAVEVPESEVGSTHYRILFLTGFVLFLFTFVFNTAAEVVRQRLRKKYGQL